MPTRDAPAGFRKSAGYVHQRVLGRNMARETDLRYLRHLCGTLVGGRPGFPSTFPPPDARPRGTERDDWGRPGIVEAVAALFVLVTVDNRDCEGQEVTIGEPPVGSVKSPASAYPGSNPGPATSATTSADMVTARVRSRNLAGRVSLIFPSRGRDADAVPPSAMRRLATEQSQASSSSPPSSDRRRCDAGRVRRVASSPARGLPSDD